MKSHSQVVELLFNSFTKVPEEDLLRENFYIKSGDEYLHVAESYDHEINYILDRIKSFNKSQLKFVMMYQSSLRRMSKELSYGSLRVMLYLISKLSFNNCVYGVRYASISDDLGGMSYSTIVSAFAELKEKKYITETGKKTNKVYHISPGICWKGSVSKMYNKLKMFIQ